MKVKLSLVFPLLLFCFNTFSQTSFFTVNQSRGCVPFTLSITGTSACGSPQVLYQSTMGWGSAKNDTLNTVVTYKQTGKDTIVMLIRCGGGVLTPADTMIIEILDTTRPAFIARTCIKDTVTLSVTESKYDSYSIAWGDGFSQTVSGNSITKHKYPNNLQRTITVSGIYSYSVAGLGMQQCGNFSTQTVKPITNLTAAGIQLLQVNTLATDSGKVSLTFSLSPDINYKIYQKAEYFTPFGPYIDTIANQPGVQTRVFKNLNTVNNKYCFLLSAYDYCASPNVDSEEICTVSISGNATLTGNQLHWDKYPAPAVYSLSVNGVAILGFVYQTDTFYNDASVQCKQVYCYKVEAGFGSFPPTIRSISAPVCITAIKPANFDVPKKFHATYEGSRLTLFWGASTLSGIRYNIYTISSPTATDTVLSDFTTANSIKPTRQNSTCYALKISDECGSSPLVRACPIALTGQADNEVQNSLQWLAGYTNGDAIPVSNYSMELFTDANVLISTESLGLSTIYIQTPIDTANQKVLYRVKAVVGDTVVYSNTFSIIQALRLYVPNAFTPNDDGNNDIYLAFGLFFDTFEMKIYNRWGQTVFSSDDRYKGWDGGSFNPDIYHYYVKVTDKFGNDLVKKGTMYLMRK